MRTLLILFAVLSFTTGCASYSSWKDPKVQLQQRKEFYVESELADGQKLHVAIAEALRVRGYKASSGYLTMIPKDADTIVSFQSRWTWDFSTYLIELDMQVRDAKTGKILATVNYHRPGVGGTSTEALIERVLNELVGPKKAAA